MFLSNEIKEHVGPGKTAIIFLVSVFVLWFSSPACAIENNNQQEIAYVTPDWVPFTYQDREGNAKGLYVDIVKEIFEKQMGIKVKYIKRPWKRAQMDVKNGKGDFLITVATEQRLEYAVKSDFPILELYLYVYTYRGHPKLDKIHNITSGSDIKQLNLVPVTNLGNIWHKNNIDSFGVETHYVPKEENAFKMLASKRADISIEPLYAGSHLINHLGLSSKVIPTRARFGPIIFHLLLGKKSRHIKKMNQINQAIQTIHTSGRLQQLLNKYETIE